MTRGRFSLDQLAAEVDMKPNTIRIWIRRGYVPPARGSGSDRYFTLEHRDRILRIKREREKQRTMPDICDYLDETDGPRISA